MKKLKWFCYEPRRFCCVLSGHDRRRNFIYNTSRVETLYDAYWAFVFGNATKVTILSTRTKKVVKVFNSKSEWIDFWNAKYGERCHYCIWHDRVPVAGGR